MSPVRPTSELHLENFCLKLTRNSRKSLKLRKYILASLIYRKRFVFQEFSRAWKESAGDDVSFWIAAIIFNFQGSFNRIFPSSRWLVKFRYISISLKRGIYTINKIINKLTIKIINNTLIILQMLFGLWNTYNHIILNLKQPDSTV